MTRGFLLFLKRNHIIPCFAISVAGTLVVNFLLTRDPNQVTDVAPLWCAAVTTIPLLFTMINEDDLDRTAPRSLALRRTILWAITSTTALFLSWLCFPDGGEWGFQTMIRDCLALAGLGIASTTFFSTSAIWVLPLLATLVSSLFSWPLYPSIVHGTAGFLRAPSGLTFSPGVPNLAWPVAIIVGVGGAGWGIMHTPHRPAGTRRSRVTTVYNKRDLVRGLRRTRLQHLCLLGCAIAEAISLFSALRYWGGSVRALLVENVGWPPFLYLLCAAATGAIVAQSRWRTGVAVWEQISPRPQPSLFWRAGMAGASTCLLGIGVSVGAAVITAVVGMAHDGLPVGLIFLEFVRGIPALLYLLVTLPLASVAGSLCGWLWRRPWVVPAVAIIAVALSYVPILRGGHIVGIEQRNDYGYKSCRDGMYVKVCTSTPNSAYLPAAVTTLDPVYQSSPHREVLPRTVILTERNLDGLDGFPETPTTVPAVGVAGSRSVFAPSSLSRSYVMDSLRYSIHDWCPEAQLGDIDSILGIYPDPDSETMKASLQALSRCRA